MFQDEGRFGRISDARHCWTPRGIRPDVPVQMIREYTYVFAAVSPHDGTLDSLVLPRVDADMMSLFLAEVTARHPDELILMWLDQAGWHRANRLSIPDTIRLLWLPPYSPQCNPVEHLWEELREKYFANRVFDSLDAMEDVLVEALATLEKDAQRVYQMTAFDWVISAYLNAT